MVQVYFPDPWEAEAPVYLCHHGYLALSPYAKYLCKSALFIRTPVLLNYWIPWWPLWGDKNIYLHKKSHSATVDSETDCNIWAAGIEHVSPMYLCLYYYGRNCTLFLCPVTWIIIVHLIVQTHQYLEACWTASFLSSPSRHALTFIPWVEKYGTKNPCRYIDLLCFYVLLAH